MDSKFTTPSDFAIMVTNLPKCSTDDVKTYFEEAIEDSEVVYVNHAYDIGNLLKLNKKADQL